MPTNKLKQYNALAGTLETMHIEDNIQTDLEMVTFRPIKSLRNHFESYPL
ncbi:protein of unknown function [Legionella fallonii LLAP-10]|uniref:Uncharacterized protein n=1 Tax=Legionella fallonii LLAP-10 TaxID=1212491 RepID=A0A098G9Y8_9GAMM|nr:protein of unknown function [Legionella fallonii LLAP-10]